MRGLEKIQWTPLRLSPTDRQPVFLLSYFTTATDSYSLTVTDLQSLWIDSASRNDIVDRAMEDGCIVDVSQSSNLSALLGKLSDSLNQNELPEGTKLHAMRYGENLRITLSISLSTNSMPLVWTFRLQSTPSPNFRRDILLGTLGIIDALQSQISTLQSLVSEKDYHISAMQDVIQECHANLYNPRRYRASFGKFNAEQWLQAWKDGKTGTCKASEVYFRGVRGSKELWGWCADGTWEVTDRDFHDIQAGDRLAQGNEHHRAGKRKGWASTSSDESPVGREHDKGQRSSRRRRDEDEEDESSDGNEHRIRSSIGGRRTRRSDTDSDSADKHSPKMVTIGRRSRRTVPKQARKHHVNASDASSSGSESESQVSGMIIGGKRGQSKMSTPPKSSQRVAGEASLNRSPSSDDVPSSGSSTHGVIGGGIIGGNRSRSSRRATPIIRDTETKDISASPVPIPQEGPPQRSPEPSIKTRESSPPRKKEDIAIEGRRMLDTHLQSRKRMPVRRRF
ncbi:XRCC4-like factor-domain-containing protein [Lipomyces kononenkoae]